MRATKGRDTRPELAVRRAVHSLGLRYRVSVRPLAGVRRTADMVFPRDRVAAFVDGCFWHGCPAHLRPARTNGAFWAGKIAATRERAADTDRRLGVGGWSVVRAWEHDDTAEVAARVLVAVLAARARRGQAASVGPRRGTANSVVCPAAG